MAWDRERDAFRREESSGVLLFRVTVMLSCLILVPAAAIFGSAFPELVRTQLIDRLKSLAGMETALPTASLPAQSATAAPAYQAHTSAQSPPHWNTGEAAPAWQPAVSPAAGPASSANSGMAPAFPTAHQVEYTAPAAAQTSPPVGRNPLASAPPARGEKYEPQVRPAAHTQPQGTTGDHFTEIQERLRSYGASRYSLEAVGNSDMYRFHCQFPASSGQQARDFEAIDRDPLVAMADVLKQVEQWRINPIKVNRVSVPDGSKPQPRVGGFGQAEPQSNDPYSFFVGFGR